MNRRRFWHAVSLDMEDIILWFIFFTRILLSVEKRTQELESANTCRLRFVAASFALCEPLFIAIS